MKVIAFPAQFQRFSLLLKCMGTFSEKIQVNHPKTLYQDNEDLFLIGVSKGGNEVIDLTYKISDRIKGFALYETPPYKRPKYIHDVIPLLIWNDYEPIDKWFFPKMRQRKKQQSIENITDTYLRTVIIKGDKISHVESVDYKPYKNFAWSDNINQQLIDWIKSYDRNYD